MTMGVSGNGKAARIEEIDGEGADSLFLLCCTGADDQPCGSQKCGREAVLGEPGASLSCMYEGEGSDVAR